MSAVFSVHHKTVDLGDIEMFYREAGPDGAPVVLLLHGFPTSSHMYRQLIPQLASNYKVLAPDLPGFGATKSPERGTYAYTFDNLYRAVEAFVSALRLDRFAIMMFDYGAPVGFRLATAKPGRVSGIISQNGNAYEEGLQENLGPLRAYWHEHSATNRDALRPLLTLEATRSLYTYGVPESKLDLISPESIAHDQAILDRDPEIQLDLFGDYGANVALYPDWQAYLRENQPPVLAVWGQNDSFFKPAGAHAFRYDVPDAEIHLLETGHFALETHAQEIGALVKDFLSRKTKTRPRMRRPRRPAHGFDTTL